MKKHPQRKLKSVPQQTDTKSEATVTPIAQPEMPIETALNNLREARRAFAATPDVQEQISKAFVALGSRFDLEKSEGETLPLQEAITSLEAVARAFVGTKDQHNILHRSLLAILQHLARKSFGEFELELTKQAQGLEKPSLQQAVNVLEQLTFVSNGNREHHEALNRALLVVVDNLNQRDESLKEVARRLHKALGGEEETLEKQTLNGLLEEATKRLA